MFASQSHCFTERKIDLIWTNNGLKTIAGTPAIYCGRTNGHQKVKTLVGKRVLEVYPKIFLCWKLKLALKYVWRRKQMIDACLTPSSFSFCFCSVRSSLHTHAHQVVQSALVMMMMMMMMMMGRRGGLG